jgi:hypothetical protein
MARTKTLVVLRDFVVASSFRWPQQPQADETTKSHEQSATITPLARIPGHVEDLPPAAVYLFEHQ